MGGIGLGAAGACGAPPKAPAGRGGIAGGVIGLGGIGGGDIGRGGKLLLLKFCG